MKDRPKYKILIVDDEESHRTMLRAVLGQTGDFETAEAADGPDAINAVGQEAFDLILLDVRLMTMSGLEVLGEIRKTKPLVPVLMMTAYASVETAVAALKAGAFDYLIKPLDIDELKARIDRALNSSCPRVDRISVKEPLGKYFDFDGIIGRSPKMLAFFETISMVAPTDATVLILGESGTGKEMVASSIHRNSTRANEPFVKVSCAALPETLLESELFGHEKGAFTGAIARREGRFQLAHRGTIFLDEVGEMSPATQTKLLRVLQEKEFELLGSCHSIKVNVRLVAATNKDLAQEVKAGRFREDLYYRLNVVPLTLPPLRDRKEDIPALAAHFFDIYRARNGKELKNISGKAMDLLIRYDWPGNIRELENCMERAVIMSRGGAISPADLPSYLQVKPAEREMTGIDLPYGISLQEVEKSLILKTLGDAGGNRSRAAEILGICQRTLRNKLKDYEVS